MIQRIIRSKEEEQLKQIPKPILVIIHQNICNIIRNIAKDKLDDKDPWPGILGYYRATYYKTLQESVTGSAWMLFTN